MADTRAPLNDGGPAFPAVVPLEHHPEQGKDYPHFEEAGMSLREWYAGQALAGLCASRQSWQGAKLVEAAFRLADAMIAQGQGRT